MKKHCIIAAFGLPGVDYKVAVCDSEIHKKYNVEFDGSKAFSRNVLEDIKALIDKKNYEKCYYPGGTCVLMALSFQHLIKDAHRVIISGAVGDDDEGKYVIDELIKAGIMPKCDVLSGKRTAFCIVLLHKSQRSVLANNGAGEEYNMQNIQNDEEKFKIVEDSKIVFFSGFFLLFSYDIAQNLIHRSREKGTAICVNLSSEYVIEKLSVGINLTKLADILIGNKKEFITFCNYLNIKCDRDEELQETMKLLQDMMLAEKRTRNFKIKKMESFKKIIVVTNGEYPITCVYSENKHIVYRVNPIDEMNILDVAGSGDSFIAGFLFGLQNEMGITECLKCGCETAAKFIQQTGEYRLPRTKNL